MRASYVHHSFMTKVVHFSPRASRLVCRVCRQVLVSFSSHRPTVAHLDERFFEMAREEEHGAFEVEHLFTERLLKPMFKVDWGSDTVHVRTLKRKE